MKLRNKISGEVKTFELFDGKELQGGVTLERLVEEWEGYEEPKEYWYIDEWGNIQDTDYKNDQYDNAAEEIGNYFETKEEAEKAVEKLKAWKRLKDNGFGFSGYTRNHTGTYEVLLNREIPYQHYDELEKDLDLLFGGEE